MRRMMVRAKSVCCVGPIMTPCVTWDLCVKINKYNYNNLTYNLSCNSTVHVITRGLYNTLVVILILINVDMKHKVVLFCCFNLNVRSEKKNKSKNYFF